MKTGFWKLSTAGNTTLFLEKRCDAGEALELICAEQAGYVDLAARSLCMAGGEFCANACLAYGALLDALGFFPEQLSIGDTTIKVRARGKMPVWEVCAQFPLPECKWEGGEDVRVCHAQGISHVLLRCPELPAREGSLEIAAGVRRDWRLDSRPAAGVVWWRQLADCLEILPVISVPSLGTCNLEPACGSASIALALGMGAGRHSIRQPSGKTLLVDAGADSISVTGEVLFQASGELWATEAV